MSDEVKTCKDCKHYIADGSSRRGHCELKRSRIDKWGQEVSIRRMASGKACKKAEHAASVIFATEEIVEIEFDGRCLVVGLEEISSDNSAFQ